MTGTLIVVPVLRRPNRAQPLVDSIRANTDGTYRILFVGTTGDVEEMSAARRTGADTVVLPGPHRRGDYARKVNFAYQNSNEPLIFTAADDLQFHAGWLTRAKARLSTTVHVVGTNDLGNARVIAGHHSTHTLVTRTYCDRFGTIDQPGMVLHEGYAHWYVDDEFVQTAQARGTFAHAGDSHVEHLHYFVKKSAKDRTYRIGEMHRIRDRARYYSRRPLWEPDAAPEPRKRVLRPGADGIVRA